MKKYIPDFFTCLNLTFGCIAILLLSKDNYNASVIFCLFAFLFDFADGYFARLLNTESAIGRELDSFSDFVTSGVVPGIVMYKLFVKSGLNEKMILSEIFNISFFVSPFSLAAFLITVSTAFRLSRFNLMKTEVNYFIGLPAPANCMMIIGLPFLIEFLGEEYLNYNILYLFTLFSVYMLNSKMKLISLKNLKKPIVLFLFFLIGASTILINFGILTIVIFSYISFSFLYFNLKT
tara:strand:- start:691 stop:1395 length:705 start_codon:yes stop_codon:yes gene_type:complete